MKKILVMAASLLMYGCASTYGDPITQEKLDQLVVGQTTAIEVIRILGRPMAETKNSDGTAILTWGHAVVTPGMHTKSQGLSVVFDGNGTVQSYSKSDTEIGR